MPRRAVWFALVLLAACGRGERPAAPAPASSEPSKPAAILVLRQFFAALQSGEYTLSRQLLADMPGLTDADAQKFMESAIEKREISAQGIDVLEQRGSFGHLREIFPDQAEAWAKKAGVSADECWALGYQQGEVAFHWTSAGPRLIRLDDVGKLE